MEGSDWKSNHVKNEGLGIDTAQETLTWYIEFLNIPFLWGL